MSEVQSKFEAKEAIGVKLLFDRAETARLLNISVVTLDREVRAGRISYHRIGDRPLFSMQCIQEYLESRKRPAVAKRGLR